jgi:hypothetical protein
MNIFISLGSRFCNGVRNILLNTIMLLMGIKPEISIDMQDKRNTWDNIYATMVRLVGNNIVYIGDKVNCYVKEGKHSWNYVTVEKVRCIYYYKGLDDKPIEQIWVTVNDGNVATRTVAIPRASNGINTDIMDVAEVFQKIIDLFSELPPRHETPAERLGLPAHSSVKTDEEFANEALE